MCCKYLKIVAAFVIIIAIITITTLDCEFLKCERFSLLYLQLEFSSPQNK